MYQFKKIAIKWVGSTYLFVLSVTKRWAELTLLATCPETPDESERIRPPQLYWQIL